MKSLKREGTNIDALIERMRDQFFKMRAQYANQLREIEAAFMDEREKILAYNLDEIDQLFAKHKQMQEHFAEQRAADEENYTKQIDNLMLQDAKDQAEHKRKLENELQILEKCMEDMKAVYQLNGEKLEFNHKVLAERKKVNSSTTEALKKKERRLTENKRNIIKKYNDEDRKYKKENQQLTQDYKRITQQFKDLQKKFRHFEKADNDRFNQIWALNEAEVVFLDFIVIGQSYYCKDYTS